jgi:hypothetical protein
MSTLVSENTSEVGAQTLAPLSKQMTVEILFSSNGKVSLLHGKKLSYILKWVEFDQELNSLTFVSTSGQMQDVGLKVPDDYKARFARTSDIYVIRVGDDGMEDFYVVPLINNDYGLA